MNTDAKELVRKAFEMAAKKILNEKARDDLRGVVNDGIRSDAVEYMSAALKRFSEKPNVFNNRSEH